MLPCNQCAYRREIPGNCHISCVFDWSKTDKRFKAEVSHHARQWFRFPYNYDPVWGPDKCPAFSTTGDPKFNREFSPIEELFSLLA